MEMEGTSIVITILSVIFMSLVMSQDTPAVQAVPAVPGKNYGHKIFRVALG